MVSLRQPVGLVLLAMLACPLVAVGGVRPGTTPVTGMGERTPNVHALVNARIVQRPGRVIDVGTVVIRDGLIAAVGEVAPPADARLWDCTGLSVYAGLIEPYAHIGLPDKDEMAADATSHWNSYVDSELRASAAYAPDQDALVELRSLGFTVALIVPESGLFHGTSALLSLGAGVSGQQILRPTVAQHLALRAPAVGRAREPKELKYPISLMGTIALARQTFLDAQWYGRARRAYDSNRTLMPPEANAALAALNPVITGSQPLIIEVDSDLDFLRAVRLADEFDIDLLVRGSGHEYRQLQRIQGTGIAVILPVDFPAAPAVADPEDAISVSLFGLYHWETAPANPARLHEAGVPFALTSDGLKKRSDFPERVRRALENGLDADAALAALTTVPAGLLGVEEELGTIEAGKRAHLIVVEGELFDEEAQILDVWIDGLRYMVEERPEIDLRGRWQLSLALPDTAALKLELIVEGKPGKLKGMLTRDSTETELRAVELDHGRVTVVFPGDSLGLPGIVRLSGSVDGERQVIGTGRTPGGLDFPWEASWQGATSDSSADDELAGTPPLPTPLSPPGAFGMAEMPVQPRYLLVTGATIWTSGPDGIMEGADLLVGEGKVIAVGENLEAPSGAVVIRASGKHITPGLIDAHTHIAVSSPLNESSQAVTAEVRVTDVLDSYDINIYRQLAGGTTVAHTMHGSANPIGGQNATIKLRWGAAPSELLIQGAAPTIKFALGENVKQSNKGDKFTSRYPQTRMGVEQIIRDRLTAARDYERAWDDYRHSKGRGMPPRRDLELDALLEVLNGERLVHCHSYRQDEILMLIRVAEDFGFTIGTFQHVLEGYKVADAIRDHGAHASTFSDWWAYKFEVYDAIPYNGAIMHRAGVNVSFNSDLRSAGGRINTDAAKAVKYGGLSPEEALHLVTINPARQLGIDDIVGSLEPGKDADFVIWSDSPLSSYARCEQSWIDGRRYFGLEQDAQMREHVRVERARIIQKILAAGAWPRVIEQ